MQIFSPCIVDKRKFLLYNKLMKKAAIYIRVSTQEQSEHGYSIGEQKERLTQYCKSMGWSIFDYYIDGGFTGGNLDRPRIKDLKSDMKNSSGNNNFDVVVVWKLDRLSRSQYDILDLIERTFLPNNVDFVSMQEAFDTATPFGRAMIGILGVFAQLEREQIKERMTMGRKARAKQGKWHGGEGAPVGYDYFEDGDGKLIINDYEAEQIRLVFEMAADNKSNSEILETLNKRGYKTKYGGWNDTSKIAKIISKNVYLGTITFDDVVVPNSHPPLISQEVFDKANAVRNNRNEFYGENVFKRTTLLSGLIWCAKCGARYGTSISKNKNKSGFVTSQIRYHVCYSRGFPNSKMAKKCGCDNKIWRMDNLEKEVLSNLKALKFDDAQLDSMTDNRQTTLPASVDLTGTNKRIAEIKAQMSKLMDLYTNDKIPIDVLNDKIDALNEEKSKLNELVKSKTTSKPAPLTKKEIKQYENIIAKLLEGWETTEISIKRKILSTLIKRIDIDGENLVFTWIFSTP